MVCGLRLTITSRGNTWYYSSERLVSAAVAPSQRDQTLSVESDKPKISLLSEHFRYPTNSKMGPFASWWEVWLVTSLILFFFPKLVNLFVVS